MFIRLTRCPGAEPILINTARISHFVPTTVDGEEASHTLIFTTHAGRIVVAEMLDEIEDMIVHYDLSALRREDEDD